MVQLITLSVEDLQSLIKNSVAEVLNEKQPQQTSENKSSYLTRKQVAETLHLSLTTLDTYTKEGLLTSYKIGHRVLYKKSEINSSLLEKISSVKYKSL